MKFTKWALLLLMMSCAGTFPRMPSSVEGASSDVWTPFSPLSKSLGSDPYHLLAMTKFVVFTDENQNPVRVVFQNTNQFEFHSDYLLSLETYKTIPRSELEKRALRSGATRRFYFGTIFEHTGVQVVENTSVLKSFELVSQDQLNVDEIDRVYKFLLKTSPELKNSEDPLFYFLLDTSGAQANGELLRELSLRGIRSVIVSSSQSSTVYNKNWNVGRVRFIEDESDPRWQSLQPTDIVVTRKAPRELNPVAGIVIENPTSPASHVSLHAQMLQIPFMQNKEIGKYLKDYDGKLVYFTTEGGIGYFVPIGSVDFHRLTQFKQSRSQIKIESNRKIQEIKLVQNISENELSAFGGKTTRSGLLARTIPANTMSKALGVPVDFYFQYMESALTPQGERLQSFIQRQMALLQKPNADIAGVLKSIRDQIKVTAIPKDILDQIQATVRAHFPASERLKLRSSSNVEDGSEFNGAGLYDSDGVDWMKVNGKPNDFAKGLNKVWRSLYNERAYRARALFGIDESQVGMGVLIQEPFKGELINGVATWIKSKKVLTVKIYSLRGEEDQVANPNEVSIPEQIQFNIFEGDPNPRFEVVDRAKGEPVGRTLMRSEQYLELLNLFNQIANRWPGEKAPESGLDFEWKLMQSADGSQRLFVKQVRPLPANQSQKFKDGSKKFVLGYAPGEKMVLGFPESTHAFGILHCPGELQVEFDGFTEKEWAAGKPILRKVSGKIQNQSFMAENVVGKLAEIQNPYSNEKSKQLQFQISTPFSEKTLLKLTAHHSFEGEKVVDDHWIVTVGPEESKTERSLRLFPGAVDSTPGECILRRNSIYDKWEEENFKPVVMNLDFSADFSGGKIKAFGTYNLLHPTTKTVFYEMKEMTVTGILKRALVIRRPQAIAYAPAHHNFVYGLAADLFASEGLTELEKKEIETKWGRFLIIESSQKDILFIDSQANIKIKKRLKNLSP